MAICGYVALLNFVEIPQLVEPITVTAVRKDEIRMYSLAFSVIAGQFIT